MKQLTLLILLQLIIWDLPLIKRSMRNELLSILVCIIYGLIIGTCSSSSAKCILHLDSFLLTSIFDILIGACCVWTDMAEQWPTNEMLVSIYVRICEKCSYDVCIF